MQIQILCFNPHIVFLEPLQNDEIKESLNQTSNKNTFEIFDTKPSTSANNDPSDPPKKKEKKTMVISQQ